MKIVKRDNAVQVFLALTPKVPDQITHLIIQESEPKLWLIRLASAHPDCPIAGLIHVNVNEFNKIW